MADLTTFKQHLDLVDQLANIVSKEEILECARLLAINLAHYELNFGTLPLDETLVALESNQPNDAQIEMLNKGLENLVGVLGSLIQGLDEKIIN